MRKVMKTDFRKIILLSLYFLFSNSLIMGQIPNKLSFQAIIRNTSNELVCESPIGMEINIRKANPFGIIVYSENQITQSNKNGLVSVEIGGTIEFDTINWASDYYFLEIKYAYQAPLTNYTNTTTIKMLSVPYAHFSKTTDALSQEFIEMDSLWIVSSSHGIGLNHITNWNSMFGWGNHNGLYRSIAYTPLWEEIVNKPTTLIGYGLFEVINTSHPSYLITNAHILNWNTMSNWGNHLGVYKPINYNPTWNDVENKPDFSLLSTTGNYSDLLNQPNIPEIPTQISSFNNDVGFFTSDNDHQQFSYSDTGDTLKLHNGGFVIIPGLSVGNSMRVSTLQVTNITPFSAIAEAHVLMINSNEIQLKGFCWSTDPIPTIADDSISVGSGAGAFAASITNLTPNKTYYIRSFAVNDAGIAYGNQVIFTTLPTIPDVLTSSVTSITHHSAVVESNVLFNGGLDVINRGVCWSTSSIPTIDDNMNMCGNGTGSFVCNIMGLLDNTTYFVRAFASNELGTAYGDTITFTTATVPSVTTDSILFVTGFTAEIEGNVASDGGLNVVEKGFCWDTIDHPTITNNKVIYGTGLGSYVSTVTGLLSNTTYYVRAYATNSAGTAYGQSLTFTTATIPTVVTLPVNTITAYSAISGGEVISDGGVPIIERGVCWNTTENPTVLYNKIIDTSGLDSFIVFINNLEHNTTYYIRAYAVNEVGIAYGEQAVFVTSQTIPIVITSQIVSILDTFAISGGIILNDGGSQILSKGVCWSTIDNPTITNYHSNDGSGNDSFSSIINNLIPNTTYFVRAYAINSIGIGYGEIFSFKTRTIPTLQTTIVTYITDTLALSGGNITSDGGTPIIDRGVTWSVNQNPTIDDNITHDGIGIGFYTSTLIGLAPNTVYFVRAYASNEIGTAYGEQLNFTTGALPNVITNEAFALTDTTAFASGNLISDGNLLLLERGLCWKSAPNPTILDNKISCGDSIGQFSTELNNLIDNVTYYVRAYATNVAGTTYGNQVSFTAGLVANIGSGVIFNNYNYQTVIYGNGQEWMAENLRTKYYSNGDLIVNLVDSSQWENTLTGAWSHFNNDPQFESVYGLLYNGLAVLDSRNICPIGWHVPNNSDWSALNLYIANNTQTAGGRMKVTGTLYWNDPNSFATNESKFSALPGGFRHRYGYFRNLWTYGYWWSSTLQGNMQYYRYISHVDGNLNFSSTNKNNGYSVRCIKD